MKRVFIITSLLAAGCMSGNEGLSEGELLTQAPIIRNAPVREGIGVMDKADAHSLLEKARQAFLREDYESCLAIIKKTLGKLPPMEVATELRAMRYEARKLLFSQQVVEGRVLAERDVYPLGGEIVLELTIVNLSPHPVRVPRRGRGSSTAVFVVDITREDWDIYGNARSERSRKLVRLEDDLELPVGGRASVRLVLPTGRMEERHLGFTVHRFSGMLRPAVILAGQERYYSAVDLEEAVVRVVPPGYEPIAADPMGTLAKAYRLGAREHLLLAAELSPPERRSAVIGRLVSFLEGSETGTWITVMAALRRLTGLGFAGRPDVWVSWWKENETRGEDGT